MLDKPHVGLQDTNDNFLANLQKDGSYSVVPRIPGGEITPEKLIVIGEVAKKYDLYTKITRSEEHTSELQSRSDLVCRLLLEKKKQVTIRRTNSTCTTSQKK